MKKLIVMALVLSLSVGNVADAKIPKTRTMTGTYYDYMCIVTKDGNEWLLSDDHPENNKYMKKKKVRYNKKIKTVYVAKFEGGQKVKVKFATMGTKKVTDDRILSVKIYK